MGERSSKRLSLGASPYRHRLSDGLAFTSTFSLRPCEMTESMSQAFPGDHHGHYQMVDPNAGHHQFHRSYTSTVIMNDDEYVVTTPTRPRRASVFEESLLSAGNYIKRKFSFGSSDGAWAPAHQRSSVAIFKINILFHSNYEYRRRLPPAVMGGPAFDRFFSRNRKISFNSKMVFHVSSLCVSPISLPSFGRTQ